MYRPPRVETKVEVKSKIACPCNSSYVGVESQSCEGAHAQRRSSQCKIADMIMRFARMLRLAVKYRDPAWITRSEVGWVHRYRDGYTVTERLSGAPLRILGENTRNLFYHSYEPKPGDVVVELGAEFGTETLFLSRSVGASGRVISVEAHPRTCAGLEKMVDLNKLTNVSVVHAAVGATSGTTTISDGPALSNVVGSGHIEVPALTLPDLLKAFHIEKVDFLKVNIEGAELPLLVSMTPVDAERIAHAVISCHDFKADRGHGEYFRTGAEVDANLARLGFSWIRQSDYPNVWGRDYRYTSRASQAHT